jgi:Activator of Hsp90 ATPase homolog 1-like protein
MHAEPRSRVTFEIEETPHGVKLTVLHDGLQSGGAMLQSIGRGWPIVVSNLKSFLATEHADATMSAR